jgi:hypothetical protein
MAGMKSFVKRGFCLAAAVACLFATGVEAESQRYVVLEGARNYQFSVRQNEKDVPGAKNVSMDSALNVIRRESKGEPVEIHFDTTGGGVDINSHTVRIERHSGVVPDWGDVTLSGSIWSKAETVVRLSTDSGAAAFRVTIRGKITNYSSGSNDLVAINGKVVLRMDACTLTTETGRLVSGGNYDGASLEINGGKFKSSGRNAIYIHCVTKMVDVDFESMGMYGVYVSNKLTIVGGRFKSTSYAVRSISDFTIVGGEFESGTGYALSVSGVGKIEGGSFKSIDGDNALVVDGGDVLVTGDAEFVNSSSANATVLIRGGKVRLDDVVITNKNTNGRAVDIASVSSKLSLGGAISPYIKGRITSRFAGSISVASDFRPVGGKYTLEPLGGACVDGSVVVVGGGKHSSNFEYSNKYYELNTKNNDITVVLKHGVVAPSYVVDGDIANGFVASIETGNGVRVIGKNNTISGILDSIMVNADGRPCNIRFGDGESVFYTGRTTIDGIRFNSTTTNVGWGRITLTGIISSFRDGGRRETSYALYVANGLSVESYLDNPSAIGHTGSVYVGMGSDFTHKSGTLCGSIRNYGGMVTVAGGNVPYIYNTTGGSLEILGGTIGSDTLRGYAIKNDKNCMVVISGNAEIISADTGKAGGTIINGGALEIYGGMVSNVDTSLSGAYIAINVESVNTEATVDAVDDYAASSFVMGGSPIIDGIISLQGQYNSPIQIETDGGYAFDPNDEVYCIATTAMDKRVVVGNGAGFIHNFVFDAVGNTGLKFAVNGNDIVAAKKTCSVAFSLNGSTSNPPETILVMEGGTIGDMLKPSTYDYVKYDQLYDGVYMVENDGEWHIHRGTVGDLISVGEIFDFGVGDDGTTVTGKMTLTLLWSGAKIRISVLESTRDLPVARNSETAAIAPLVSSSGALTAGPNPVSRSLGAVSFFRSGAALKDGKLFIYDASGNIVATLFVNDPSGVGRRPVAKWNLQDAKGRKAAEGTYAARGVITTKAGKTERVSILINVQR